MSFIRSVSCFFSLKSNQYEDLLQVRLGCRYLEDLPLYLQKCVKIEMAEQKRVNALPNLSKNRQKLYAIQENVDHVIDLRNRIFRECYPDFSDYSFKAVSDEQEEYVGEKVVAVLKEEEKKKNVSWEVRLGEAEQRAKEAELMDKRLAADRVPQLEEAVVEVACAAPKP